MELTMKKYMQINNILFILWSILFLWGFFIHIAMGFTAEIYIVYFILSIITITVLKSVLNLKITNKKISILFLILNWLIMIFLLKKIMNNDYFFEINKIILLLTLMELLFLETFINLIFIKNIRKKLIINFFLFNLIIYFLILINKKIYYQKVSYELKFVINILIILILTFPILYQKILEYKYFKSLLLEKNLKRNFEIFLLYKIIIIYIFFISIFGFIILYSGLNSKEDTKKLIFSALLIFIITKIFKFFIITKIFKLNNKYIKIEILIYFIFTFLMLFKNIPYEIKFFTIPLIYIYLDMVVTRRILKNDFFKLKKISLKSIITAIVIITLILFILLKNYTIFLIVGLNYILPILILIEKLIEYNAVREIEAKDIY